jgi:hypothetical protein
MRVRAVTKAKKEDSATRAALLAEAVMKADAEDDSIMNPKCKYPDANSDRERAAAVIPDWRRAKRNSPSERRIEL